MTKLKVGDRVRVVKGSLVFKNETGVIVEDDGEDDLNLWVKLDEFGDWPFSESELMKIG